MVLYLIFSPFSTCLCPLSICLASLRYREEGSGEVGVERGGGGEGERERERERFVFDNICFVFSFDWLVYLL